MFFRIGKQFLRTEWYLIVHDIETNPFCVLLQQQKNCHPTRKPLPIIQKGRILKDRTILHFKTTFFSPTRILLPINIITKLGKTDWFMILISFCFHN